MQETIKAKIKEAMMAKNMERLNVLRLISSAFTNELVSMGKPPTEKLEESECLKVIKRMVKQRKDSIDQFTAGGRPDLAESEQAELVILSEFMPAQLSEEQIEAKVKEVIASGADTSNVGKFVGMMVKELGDQADGVLIKQVIDKVLAA